MQQYLLCVPPLYCCRRRKHSSQCSSHYLVSLHLSIYCSYRTPCSQCFSRLSESLRSSCCCSPEMHSPQCSSRHFLELLFLFPNDLTPTVCCSNSSPPFPKSSAYHPSPAPMLGCCRSCHWKRFPPPVHSQAAVSAAYTGTAVCREIFSFSPPL